MGMHVDYTKGNETSMTDQKNIAVKTDSGKQHKKYDARCTTLIENQQIKAMYNTNSCQDDRSAKCHARHIDITTKVHIHKL